MGFVFHASDIFHGSGYFDRKIWSQEKRLKILADIAAIIEVLYLPVVAGMYAKDVFGIGIPEIHQAAHERKRDIMQTASVLDCAAWVTAIFPATKGIKARLSWFAKFRSPHNMCGRVIQSSAPIRLAVLQGMDVRDSRAGTARRAKTCW